MYRDSRFIKVVSAVVSIFFMVNNVSWATPNFRQKEPALRGLAAARDEGTGPDLRQDLAAKPESPGSSVLTGLLETSTSLKSSSAGEVLYLDELDGSAVGIQRVAVFDFARTYEMVELTKGIDIGLPQDLGEANLYETLKTANIKLVSPADTAILNTARGVVDIDNNSIYVLAASADDLRDTDFVGLLINAGIKLAARQRALKVSQPWDEDIAQRVDNMASQLEKRYSAEIAQANVAVLTKPENFDEEKTRPIKRKYQKRDYIRRLERLKEAGRLTDKKLGSKDQNAIYEKKLRQLDAVETMWDRYYKHMKKGDIDALIFTCRKEMFAVERERIERERGVTFPAEAVVVLVGLDGEQCKENLNSLCSGLVRAIPVLREHGIDHRHARILNIQLTGVGSRNEPLTHTAGLGNKENMFTPAGLPFLTRTLIETYQFIDPKDNRPHMTMRANDQAVLSADPDVFNGDFGYMTVGKRLIVTDQMRNNPTHADRNNCLMQLNSESIILDAMEKPRGDIDKYVGKDGRSPASLFIRRFAPEGISSLVETFFAPGLTETSKGKPLYRAYGMTESFMLIEAGNINNEPGDTEDDNVWTKEKTSGRIGLAKDIPMEDWLEIRRRAQKMSQGVRMAFGDMGNDAIFIDTGMNSEYHREAFLRTLEDPVLQAHFDVMPDENGNILIRSELGEGVKNVAHIQDESGTLLGEAEGPVRNVYGIDVKIKSGHIGERAVLLTVIAKQAAIEGNSLTVCAEEKDDTLVTYRDHLHTQMWDRRDFSKVDIEYPLAADIKKDFNNPMFGKNRDVSFSNLGQIQSKGMTIALQQRAMLPLDIIFDESPVLAIGGSGYVGTGVVRTLAATGMNVITYDNFSIGHRRASENIAKEFGHVEIEEGDILDAKRLEEVIEGCVKKHGSVPRFVYLFSALSVVPESVEEPVRYYLQNVLAILRVLQVMKKYNIPYGGFSDTAAEYGEPRLGPNESITEEFPTRPINPYGTSKNMIGKMMLAFAKAYGLKVVRLRYFNVFGASKDAKYGEDHNTPPRGETHLTPMMMQKLMKGQIIKWDFENDPTRVPVDDAQSCPDGTTIRDYVDMDDLGILHLLAMQYKSAGGKEDLFNGGRNEGISAKQMADSIIDVLEPDYPDVRDRFNIEGKRPGDPDLLRASGDKAAQHLGWLPFATVRESLESAYTWHKRHPEGYSVEDVKSPAETLKPGSPEEDKAIDEILEGVQSDPDLPEDLKFEIFSHFAGDVVGGRKHTLETQKKIERDKGLSEEDSIKLAQYTKLDNLISPVEIDLFDGVTVNEMSSESQQRLVDFIADIPEVDQGLHRIVEAIKEMLPATMANQIRSKTSSAGIFKEKEVFLKGIVQLNAGNLVAINPLDYAEGTQRDEVLQAYDKDSTELQDLENKLGCTIRLVSQITSDDIRGKEVVSISDADISLPHSELATRIKRIGLEAENRLHHPLAFVICLATQLFGDKTLGELEQALNRSRLFVGIFGQPATRDMIQNFLATGFFKLPVPRFDYEKVEDLQRQAMLAAIAA